MYIDKPTLAYICYEVNIDITQVNNMIHEIKSYNITYSTIS